MIWWVLAACLAYLVLELVILVARRNRMRRLDKGLDVEAAIRRRRRRISR